jgi:hypothetical protein
MIQGAKSAHCFTRRARFISRPADALGDEGRAIWENAVIALALRLASTLVERRSAADYVFAE